MRNLTLKSILLVFLAAGTVTGRAENIVTNWTSGFANGGVVPDGNPSGWWDTRTLDLPLFEITALQVNLTLSGGWNGDLFAYLSHDTGYAVLLNRVGRSSTNDFGYGDAGLFEVVFDDAAPNGDIHFYRALLDPVGAALTGTWQPDGRGISPLSSGAVFESSNRNDNLNSLIGMDPNGEWTLFIADFSGGGQTTVVSWGLNMQAVPEPGTYAMLLLGLGVVAAGRRLSRPRA